MMNEPRNRTLRDSLATIRRRRRPIILITLTTVLVALGISLVQSRTYTAESSFRVKDLSESLALSDLLPRQGELPSTTAAQGAESVTTEEVLERAQGTLEMDISVDELGDRVSATQEPASNLIAVAADAPTAEEAAEIANAVTTAAVGQATERVRDRFAKDAADLRAKADQLGSVEVSAGASADDLQSTADLLAQRQVLNSQANKFDLLSTVADLADVAETATPPSSPSSPKPVQNSIIGGIVGLLLGLGMAFALESLDRRLRKPDEMQAVFDQPLVGIVASSAMGGLPITGTPAEEHIAAMDAFRMLRTNIAFLGASDAGPRVVLVTSALPEEGKTTVATGLALASAASGQRTLLVEADFHRPVHADRIGIEPEPGLADYLTGHAKPGDILQPRAFVDPAVVTQNGDAGHPSQLVCITAGSRDLWSGEMLNGETFTDFLGQVRKVYDLVVIDSGPLLAVAETLQIVPAADAVLFCVRMGQTTREQAKAGKESLDRLPKRLMGLIATGVTAEDSDGYSYYSYAYSYRFGNSEDAGFLRSRVKAGASKRGD